MTYDQTKLLIEELNKMKINVKAQRDILIRYKSKTEVFAKNFEKLFHDKRLQNISETNIMDCLTTVVLSRNDLINSEVLSGVFVNDFRCYEWSLNALVILRGYLVFMGEYSQKSGACDNISKMFNNKKTPLFKQVLNHEVLFRDLYHEGQSMQKLFETSKFYNPKLLEEMALTIQIIERLKEQTTALRLKGAQLESDVDEVLDSLKMDKSFRIRLKTQRGLFMKMKDVDQFIKEIIDTRINLEDEYTHFFLIKSKAIKIQNDLKQWKSQFRKGIKVHEHDAEDLVSRIIELPINLEESEDFSLDLLFISQYFADKFRDFSKKNLNQIERLQYIRSYCSKVEKFPLMSEEIDRVMEVSKLLKSLELAARKKNESFADGFSKIVDKLMKTLKKLKLESESDAFSTEISLLIYTLMIMLACSVLQIFEQETGLKFGVLQKIFQEFKSFTKDLPEEIRSQQDFPEFCDLHNKIQSIYREIGLELKKKAYGIKTRNGESSSISKPEMIIYKGVNLTEELRDVLNLGEEEFIAFFVPFDSDIMDIHREKTFNNSNINSNKIEIEHQNNFLEIFKQTEEKSIVVVGEEDEEYEILMQTYEKHICRNGNGPESDFEIEEDDDELMEIESDDEDEEDYDDEEEDDDE